MSRFVSILALVAILTTCVRAFPSGAPPEACSTMTPQHQGIQPHPNPAPFHIKLDKDVIPPGQTLTVTLESLPGKYRYFQGFFIVAVPPENFVTKIGTFSTNIDKYVACGPNPYSAVTHSSRTKKSSTQIRWMAPADYQGQVVFVATFVENFSTFWIGQQSQTVTVTNVPIVTLLPTPPPPPPPPPPKQPSSPVSSLSSNYYQTIAHPDPTSSYNGHLQSLPTHHSDVSISEMYSECDVSKGCYGEPAGCTILNNCDLLVTFHRDGNDIQFQLVGPANGWIALGISKDRNMGDDSVVECVRNWQTGLVKVYTSYNNPDYSNTRLELQQEGLSQTQGHLINNHIVCSFTRQGMMAVRGVPFDLLHEPHYLFLASGLAAQSSADQLQKHSSRPYRSQLPVDVTAVSNVAGASDGLLYAHGCLMVIAWIGTTSVAVFLARFYKYTWIQTTHCGEQVWFTWHRCLNVCTVLLTSTSIIIIFSYVGGWSATWRDNAHPLLGILTTVLMWAQPIMASVRPHPGTPNRPIFNWAHFLVGNSARILAVATLFLAKQLQKAQLPSGFSGVLIAYIVFELLCHLFMEGYSCIRAREGKDQIPLKEMPPASPTPEPTTLQKSKDAPGSRFRRSFLGVYVVGITGLTIALVTVVIASSSQPATRT